MEGGWLDYSGLLDQPRIPRAKTSLLLHPRPRRPRASLPRSLPPASSQERHPTAAAPPRPCRTRRGRPPRSILLLPTAAAMPRPSRSRRGRPPSSPPPRPAAGATLRPRRSRLRIVLLPLGSAAGATAGADFGPFSAAGTELDLGLRRRRVGLPFRQTHCLTHIIVDLGSPDSFATVQP
uniref:Uncharacterized protein n=1 Tax=Oryza barthii TaxID=65489 RepID=A0A0D3HLI6_9ORYZ